MPESQHHEKPLDEARLREFLDVLLRESGWRLSYRFLTRPAGEERDFENPELLVDFDGADAAVLLANDAEALRAAEHLAHEALRLGGEEHERLVFDCHNRRMLRVNELRMAAELAAQRVAKSGVAYAFAPMNSRERRVIHMALRGAQGVRSGSQGVGHQRHVVIEPLQAAPPARSREYRRL